MQTNDAMKNAMEEAGLGPSTNGTSNQSNQSQEQTEETPVEKADRLIEELQEITEVKGDASPDEVSERASRETELYAELLEVLRHLSKVIRKLKYEGQQNTAVYNLRQEVRERLMNEVPSFWESRIRKRIHFDALIERVEHYTHLISEEWDGGNPYRLLEKASRRAEEIGYVRSANDEERKAALSDSDEDNLHKMHLIVNFRGETKVFVPEKEGSSMSKVLFDRLHDLRVACTEEVRRYKEEREQKKQEFEERLEELQMSPSRVTSLLNGEQDTVIGKFPWEGGEAYLDARGVGNGTTPQIQINRSDAFSSLEGKVIDPSHKAWGALYAALQKLKSRLEEQNNG